MKFPKTKQPGNYADRYLFLAQTNQIKTRIAGCCVSSTECSDHIHKQKTEYTFVVINTHF